MNKTIDRLKEFISKTGLSDRSFALGCNIKQNTLSRQLNGTSDISYSTVCAIALQYPELSLEWLIRGDGKMYLSDDDTYVKEGELTPVGKKVSNTILTLSQIINDQEEENDKLKEELEKLKKELKKYKQQ